jgi:two-component system CheB/CheR fusion protein
MTNTAETDTHDRATRIVGIGASAGAIPPLKLLLRDLQPEGSVAFVVVSHLTAGRESSLVSILQGHTPLPVSQVVDGTTPLAGHVYVIPPGVDLVLRDGVLRLSSREPGLMAHAPIDRFFRSLADGLGRDAACVILSGTGADGTLGLKRIKEEGGLTMVQTPEDAEYDSMPRNAIATGLVDLALPAAELGHRLRALAIGGDLSTVLAADGRRADATADTLRDILTLVRIRSGHDFSTYKRATLLRRVSRRMQVCQTETITDYHQFLREHPTELAGLLRDFLISVTSFFRDPEVFDAITAEVLPRIFAAKERSSQVRIWVPACATGEEAYSLAMLAAERAATIAEPPSIQIFATDIDEEALAEARAGRYPETIAADLSRARLERFFVQENGGYRVKKEIREMVLFSPHNVLRDPPFSKLDLVSCRNLLIYLNRDAQDRVLGILHFALRPDGLLMLGASESAESVSMLFTPVDAKHRVYVRRPATSPVAVTTMFPVGKWHLSPPAPAAPGHDRVLSIGELHHKLVEFYAPPSMLVNEELDVVHLSEHAGRYLTITGGEPTRHLLRLIHPDLRLELRAAIYAARQHERGSDSRPVHIERDGKDVVVQIQVRSLEFPDVARGMLLILFDEQTPARLPAPSSVQAGDPASIEPVVRQLEDEVHRTRDQLRTTVEQYETTVEELKASNEGLHAINEELRSATEELETSKEELQSVNEELTTLNHELKEKVDEVSRTNSDLQNLMTSTDIGVLFLDRDLNIKRFTPRAQELFNVIPSDVGRPLGHVTHRLDYDELPADAAQVLQHLRTVERGVRSKDGQRFLARLHPYRSLEDRIDGVVLTFIDVTDLKQAEASLRASDALLQLATRAAEAGTWELEIGSDELHLSEECQRLYGVEVAAGTITIERWLDIIEDSHRDRVGGALRAAVERGDELDIEFPIRGRGRETRWLWHLGRVSPAHDGRPSSLSGIAVDVTRRIRTEAALRASEERFRLALRTTPVVMLNQDRQLRYTWGYMMGGEVNFLGKTDADLFPPDEAARLTELKRAVMSAGVGRREEVRLTLGGRHHYYDFNIEPIRSEHGVVGVTCAAVDVTASRLAELALRDADRRKDEFLATLAHELRNPLAPLRSAIDLQKLAGTDLAKVERAREVMDRQVDQIVHLVDDLLDMSRITQGKIHIRLAPLAVRSVVSAALEATRDVFSRGHHELVVEVPDDLPLIQGDATRMTQVMTNLLSNAAKYTPPGGHIRLVVEAPAGEGVLRIRVSDDGVGIAGDMLPRVFDMFAQARDAASLSPGGLGIGLTLVKRLVELHGGFVTAHSEGPGKGSTFVVTLPTASASPEPALGPRRRATGPAVRRRVLVVDDNPDVTDTICEVLEMIGHVTRQASDGAAALTMAAEFQPELVILDLGLPGLSGFEVARALRAGRGSDIVIVALTGWGQQSDLTRSRDAGFDYHLVKPAGLEALRELVGDAGLT